MFDVTDLVGTQGTADDQAARQVAIEAQVRDALYEQGYRMPYDHEDEADWRQANDRYRRALFNG